MHLSSILPMTLCCAILIALAAWADDETGAIPMESAADLGTVRVPFEESIDLSLPALPTKPGTVVVLRFGAVANAKGPAGCNFNMTMKINGAAVGRYLSGGDERLIGRPATFRFAQRALQDFPVFSGPRLMLMYAPDSATADKMTEDGLGGTFVLDVSDMVSGVDGNTLTITNTRPKGENVEDLYLIIESIQAGWVNRDALPAPGADLPSRGAIEQSVSKGGIRLAQGMSGGFTVSSDNGPELLIETGLGMKRDAPSDLLAQDEAPEDAGATATVTRQGEDAFVVQAEWPNVRLSRTVRLRDGLVEWTERWTNKSDDTIGLPFRHRAYLREDAARFTLAGDADAGALAGCATNPTMFLESRKQPGAGCGVTAESDWLRLLLSVRGQAGLGELYSDCLALPAQGSIDFEWTISPVQQGGYWSFINGVRERWGVNGVTMQRPLFWGYARAEGADEDEILRKSLGHLGPIYVTNGGWMRLTPDAISARTGQYPKLAADAAAAPGDCPDLDADEFLKSAHRDRWWQSMAETAASIKRTCPDAKVINITHPAMEVVYEPLAARFPISAEVIQTPDGKPFAVHHYSVAHLYGAAQKGWAVYYYSPRPGSRYLQSLIDDCGRSMDFAGSDGVYCDEFSWAGRNRGYSRYDYSRWDGYSADLDADGNVVRLKSDNAHVSESCQLQMIHECLARDKFFLGNGGSALRSVNSLPIFRFVEGGNGHGTMAGGHLSTAPLVLGNFGDEKTVAGVFEAVKQCLSLGCLYSPTAVNLLLTGDDNFVCKLYPITVRRLEAGWVAGDERLITSASGEYDWPGVDATARLYRYDAQGNLLDSDGMVECKANAPTAITVPESGLVIAQIEK